MFLGGYWSGVAWASNLRGFWSGLAWAPNLGSFWFLVVWEVFGMAEFLAEFLAGVSGEQIIEQFTL